MGLTWLLIAKVPRAVWGVLAILLMIFTAYGLGGQNKAAKLAQKERTSYHETTQKIDRAINADSAAGAARERLRDKFGKWTGDM